MSDSIFAWELPASVGDNDDADATINFAEGQLPDTVNNSARALMARVAEFRDDLLKHKTTGGSSTAYTVTATQQPASLPDGFALMILPHATNTGACTINVNGLGAKNLRSISGANLLPGSVVINRPVAIVYRESSDEFLITSDVSGESSLHTPKNYIVNPGFRISQENGQTAGTANGYYPADQHYILYTHSGTTTVQNIDAYNSSGTRNRNRMTVTAGNTSPAVGDFFLMLHPLEGLRVADLSWGTSNAIDVVVRFGFKGPAGTYAVCIRNTASDRSFVREFTISGGNANTDTLQTFTFPGDTSGTWANGNALGMTVSICLAAGSTYQTTADAWQAGDYLGTSSTSNGIGTTSDVFEVWDLGMYADPSGIGVAPRFEIPHYTEDLIDCKRYYEIVSLYPDYNDGISNTAIYRNYELSVEKMASIPSVSVSTQVQYYSAGTPTNVTPSGLLANADTVSVQLTGLTSGRGIFSGGVAVNSRLI